LRLSQVNKSSDLEDTLWPTSELRAGFEPQEERALAKQPVPRPKMMETATATQLVELILVIQHKVVCKITKKTA
jgi:hypothetical protein